jgi:membrane-associated phospholipid phosphatase
MRRLRAYPFFIILLFCLGAVRAAKAQDRRLEWRPEWRRVGPVEYATTTGFTLGAIAMEYLVPRPSAALWTRPIWFDAWVRDQVVIESPTGRRVAARVSDGVALASMLHPLLVDSVLVAGFQDRSADVGFQMGMISVQSYSVTLLANGVAKTVLARERPYGAMCTKDSNYTEGCPGLDRFRSYYSGHSALTATSAGLVCAHHTHLPLYGGGVWDVTACAGAVAGTLATGTLRISSDRHWATDVLTGHLLGFASGYLLPTLVYYKSFRAEPKDSAQSGLARPQLVLAGAF